MGIFFEKPVKGPDVVGGIWPIKDRGKFHNRCGRTVSKGEVLALAWTAGEASEIATNDVNSYVPGASNDTVWNTVIDTVTNIADGSSRNRGGCWVVATDQSVADNGVVNGVAFGIIAEAFCVGTALKPGDPLTVTLSNSLTFAASNQTIIAHYMAPQATLSTKALRRVFLHQGLFAPHHAGPSLT